MTQIIILFFGFVLALRLYLSYKKVFLKPEKITNEIFFGNVQVKDILENDLTWKGYENKYDAEIVKKRRSKFISMYNEMRTKDEYFIEKPLEVRMATQKFYKRIVNIKVDPAKAFRMILIPLLFCVQFAFGQNKSEAESFVLAGTSFHENKRYPEAIESFRKALASKPKADRLGAIHYKIALSFEKLKRCDSAKVHFMSAIQFDPAKGGASSLSKFEEKIRECRLTMAEVSGKSVQVETEGEKTEAEEPEAKRLTREQEQEQADKISKSKDFTDNIIISIITLVLTLIVSWIIQLIMKGIWVAQKFNKTKLGFDALANDESFWQQQIQNGFPEVRVQQVKDLFYRKSIRLSKVTDKAEMDEINAHYYFIQNNPELYFAPDSFVNGYAKYLLGVSGVGFYCFFSGVYLEESKSAVLLIQHPARPELNRRVWVSGAVKRKIDKGGIPKIRLHNIDGFFTHWSNDVSYYLAHRSEDPFESDKGNSRRIENWKGEAKEISLDKYYEIFTDEYLNYLFPESQCVVQAVILYQGVVKEAPQTGFEEQSGEKNISRIDNDLDNVTTAIIVDDMIRDRDDNDYDVVEKDIS